MILIVSDLFDFHLFADDTNLFYKHKDITLLQSNLNKELSNVDAWLCANKLSLNMEKSNFVMFHPRQKKIDSINLMIKDNPLKQEYCIKYLGVLIDSNLNWQNHVNSVIKKIKRSVGILSKLRHFIGTKTLINIYYALVYPFLTYGIIIARGNTYPSNLQSLYILQKKCVRIITFSKFDERSSPLFKRLNIIKLFDLVTFYIALFIFKFRNNILPPVFDSFFIPVCNIHDHCTRHAARLTYSLPQVRTNYGISNVRFQGARIWNSLDDDVKSLSISQFKKKLKSDQFEKY